MGKKKYDTKPVDITQTGYQTWKDLQQQNNSYYAPGEVMSFDEVNNLFNTGEAPTMSSALQAVKHYNTLIEGTDEQSPILTGSQGKDFFGNSFFDQDILTDTDWQALNAGNYNELRAENQPWLSKLVNGIGKAGVLAVTTALETAGLLYGAIAQGPYNAFTEEGNGWDKAGSFLHGLWDNPITNALQKVNEWSEEFMPNYYTQDELENPWGNIFTANFLGDKLLKNLGFMVGAFYGGEIGLALTGAAKIGTAAVKGARAAAAAEAAGRASRFAELTAGYADDVLGKVGKYGREISGLADDAAAKIGANYGDEVTDLYRKLAKEGLTEGERGEKMLKGLDKINRIANTTRATTQTIGVVGAAINEGAIEALNNSKDWADMRIKEANDEYAQKLSEIEKEYGDLESLEAVGELMEAANDHNRKLAAIEKGRAEVGNADLLMNLPILLASNAYQLGRLYTRGFDTARRGLADPFKSIANTRREMGSLWNGHKLAGSLEKGTLDTSKKTWKGVLSALSKSNTEGVEELTQRMASDASGNAVDNAIARYMSAGNSEEAKTNVDDYIAGMGKAISENLQDPKAWEEYMIGAVSSLVGMPVFGSQTKNAYLGKGKAIGLQGGFFGELNAYRDDMKRERDVAEYLNKRVKSPEFKAYYDGLKKHFDYEKWQEEVMFDENGKLKFKDLDLENFYHDINAAASSGHLEEFKQLVGFNQDYTDEELKDIVKQTSKTVTASQQRKQDENRKAYLEGVIDSWETSNLEDTSIVDSRLKDTSDKIEKINEQLSSDPNSDTAESLQQQLSDLKSYQRELTKEKEKILSKNTRTEAKNKQRQAIQEELDAVNKRLEDDESGENKYKDKQEGPFIDRNGEMNVTDPDLMREILDRNRRNLLKGIDDYLKIRNDIDIETDGRLDDRQIATLTMMRGHILDYEKRSAEMTDDIVSNLTSIMPSVQKKKDTADSILEKAQKALENAKQELKDASNEDKIDKKKVVLAAEKLVNEAKMDVAKYSNFLALYEKLTNPQETSRRERRALNRGYGRNEEKENYTDQYGDTKNIGYEEMQDLMSRPKNIATLAASLMESELDDATIGSILSEVSDLKTIGEMKKAYNLKVREWLNDPSLINEAYQQIDDNIKQKDLDNKANDLALRIQGVNNMAELDQILRESSAVSSRVTQAALQKAKQEGSDSIKSLIDDYEKGRQFFMEFQNQASKLSPDLNMALSEAAITSWQEALADNLNVYDKFIEHMNESADLLDEAGDKKTAKALRQVMKDLNSAKKSSATNKNVAEPSEKTKESSEEKAKKNTDDHDAKIQAEGGLAAAMKRTKGKKGKTSEAKPATIDAIIEKAMKEIVASSMKKSSIASLSDDLQKMISEYNEDNSHEKITDETLKDWIQNYRDEEWENHSFERDYDDEDDFDGEEYKENRGMEMSQATRGSFKSGYQTEFRIDKVGGRYLDYAVPYPGEDEQHKKVRQLLKDYLAYQFVDNNWLGYAMKAYGEDNIPVHFLKSTEHGVNKPDMPVTFMAIKLTPGVKRAIQKYAYNDKKGKVDISEGIRPVTIGDSQYQIIGVLSINSEENVSPEVASAFKDLQMKLFEELHTKVAEEKKKENPEPFVISENLQSEITQVFTGRLEKYNDADDDGDRVSLFTFMTSPQNENGGREDRKTSLEWRSGVPFHFGVVVNRGLRMQSVDDSMQVEEPNQEWRAKKGNNGAILLFVPKPDGKLYPLRCVRRSVSDWLKSDDIDGTHKSGEEFLEDLLNADSSVKNAYLERIIHLIDVLTSEDDKYSFSDRLDAKYRLATFFTFGRKNPIQIDVSTQDATITIGEEEAVTLNADNLHDNVMALFDAISKSSRIRFTLPAPNAEGSNKNPDGKIDAKDIIMSGVFEIGLRGFYNFNSNVIVKPIDGNGNEVVVKTPPAKGGTFGPNEKNGEDRSYSINGENKDYHISYEDGVAKVTYKDGSIPSDDEQNIVLALENIDSQNNENTKLDLVTRVNKDRGVSMTKEQNKLIADDLSDELSGYYTVYSADGILIYDEANQELFSLDNKKGQELLGKVKASVIKWLESPEAFKALKKVLEDNGKKGRGSAGPQPVPKTIFNTSTVENKQGAKILSEGMLIADKAGDASTYTTGTVNGKKVFYPSAPLAVVRTSANQQSFFLIDKSTATATEAGGYVVYGPGEYEERKGAIVVTKEAKIGYYKNSPDELVGKAAGPQQIKPEGKPSGTGTEERSAEKVLQPSDLKLWLEIKEYLSNNPDASGIDLSNKFGLDIVSRDRFLAAWKIEKASRGSVGGGDYQSSGILTDVTLENLKSRKEESGLVGTIARAFDDKKLKSRATKVFNVLKTTDESFGITMPEKDLTKKVEDIFGTKKGWNDKLNELVDELSKCK